MQENIFIPHVLTTMAHFAVLTGVTDIEIEKISILLKEDWNKQGYEHYIIHKNSRKGCSFLFYSISMEEQPFMT